MRDVDKRLGIESAKFLWRSRGSPKPDKRLLEELPSRSERTDICRWIDTTFTVADCLTKLMKDDLDHPREASPKASDLSVDSASPQLIRPDVQSRDGLQESILAPAAIPVHAERALPGAYGHTGPDCDSIAAQSSPPVKSPTWPNEPNGRSVHENVPDEGKLPDEAELENVRQVRVIPEQSCIQSYPWCQLPRRSGRVLRLRSGGILRGGRGRRT